MADDLLVEVEKFVEQFEKITAEKNYWLIRTQSGLYYESFRKHNFVAIEHEKISLYDISSILQKYPSDRKSAIRELKDLSARRYPHEKQPGIIAGQIYKFVEDIKKGDIVIIPSENSNMISIGEVTSYVIPELTDAELTSTDCDYKKRKAVKWIKDLNKSNLDPYMFKMLQSHQAISNVSNYGEIVERSIGNFFIKDGEASLVLEVRRDEDINAQQLFSLGHYLLEYSQDFFRDAKIDLDVSDVEVKINLNSRGRIQFKAPNGGTIWLIAVLVIAVAGGGLKVKTKDVDFDLSTDGIIKKVIDYQNNSHDRAIVSKLSHSLDSLKVMPPTDAVEVLKQFSTNKDLPK